MTKRMHWDTAAKRNKLDAERGRTKEIVPVQIDASFWRSWKDDPKAMREAGYHVRKERDGRWRAWIER
jgi:hypothetical protein